MISFVDQPTEWREFLSARLQASPNKPAVDISPADKKRRKKDNVEMVEIEEDVDLLHPTVLVAVANRLKNVANIPSAIDAKSLLYLNISFNALRTIPPCLDELKSLEHLDVSHNKLENLDFIEPLQSLKVLRANSNRLTSILPVSFASTTLEELWISENKVDWLEFTFLRDCKRLRILVKRNNPCDSKVKLQDFLLHSLPTLQILDDKLLGEADFASVAAGKGLVTSVDATDEETDHASRKGQQQQLQQRTTAPRRTSSFSSTSNNAIASSISAALDKMSTDLKVMVTQAKAHYQQQWQSYQQQRQAAANTDVDDTTPSSSSMAGGLRGQHRNSSKLNRSHSTRSLPPVLGGGADETDDTAGEDDTSSVGGDLTPNMASQRQRKRFGGSFNRGKVSAAAAAASGDAKTPKARRASTSTIDSADESGGGVSALKKGSNGAAGARRKLSGAKDVATVGYFPDANDSRSNSRSNSRSRGGRSEDSLPRTDGGGEKRSEKGRINSRDNGQVAWCQYTSGEGFFRWHRDGTVACRLEYPSSSTSSTSTSAAAAAATVASVSSLSSSSSTPSNRAQQLMTATYPDGTSAAIIETKHSSTAGVNRRNSRGDAASDSSCCWQLFDPQGRVLATAEPTTTASDASSAPGNVVVTVYDPTAAVAGAGAGVESSPSVVARYPCESTAAKIDSDDDHAEASPTHRWSFPVSIPTADESGGARGQSSASETSLTGQVTMSYDPRSGEVSVEVSHRLGRAVLSSHRGLQLVPDPSQPQPLPQPRAVPPTGAPPRNSSGRKHPPTDRQAKDASSSTTVTSAPPDLSALSELNANLDNLLGDIKLLKETAHSSGNGIAAGQRRKPK